MKVLNQPELNGQFIAQQLKTLRLSMDKKITEIAEATGYAPSYISLIENGKRSLNYRILRRILLYGFGETLSSFLAKVLNDDTTSHDTQVYKTPLKLYNEDKTVSAQILIPMDISRGIELVKLTLLPGSSFEEEFKVDFKVHGAVLNGTVEIYYPDQKIEVSQNESFTLSIRADLNYSSIRSNFRISNLSKSVADIIVVFTPPVF